MGEHADTSHEAAQLYLSYPDKPLTGEGCLSFCFLCGTMLFRVWGCSVLEYRLRSLPSLWTSEIGVFLKNVNREWQELKVVEEDHENHESWVLPRLHLERKLWINSRVLLCLILQSEAEKRTLLRKSDFRFIHHQWRETVRVAHLHMQFCGP